MNRIRHGYSRPRGFYWNSTLHAYRREWPIVERWRTQEARSLEPRAAGDLARLWAEQDRRAEAQDLLAPVYGWFTEGFDTPDLREAKALLDELA